METFQLHPGLPAALIAQGTALHSSGANGGWSFGAVQWSSPGPFLLPLHPRFISLPCFPMGSWFLEFPSLPCNLNKDLYMHNLPILQCVCIYAFIYTQWYIVYICYKCVIYCIHNVSLFIIYIYTYKVKIHIGWAKKFVQIFLYHLMDETFGQPNIWNVYYTVYIALHIYD